MQFVTRENTQRVFIALSFLRALFFISCFVFLDLKQIINLCNLSTLDCTSLILFDAAEKGRSDGM